MTTLSEPPAPVSTLTKSEAVPAATLAPIAAAGAEPIVPVALTAALEKRSDELPF
jgi:hypothetical protein